MEKAIRREILKIDAVATIRGKGLLLGIVLKDTFAQTLVEKCVDFGVLVNAPASNVIRIAPALSVSLVQVKEFSRKFALAVKEALAHE